MTTKEEIQVWAREEWARLDLEKTENAQAVCDHARYGIYAPNSSDILCDDCKKVVTMSDF